MALYKQNENDDYIEIIATKGRKREEEKKTSIQTSTIEFIVAKQVHQCDTNMQLNFLCGSTFLVYYDDVYAWERAR